MFPQIAASSLTLFTYTNVSIYCMVATDTLKLIILPDLSNACNMSMGLRGHSLRRNDGHKKT